MGDYEESKEEETENLSMNRKLFSYIVLSMWLITVRSLAVLLGT